MNRICVIGGANIDICGSSVEKLRYFDSNPGMISLSYGGVGRNIAQILALLGEQVDFLTCFSSDNYGTMMRQDCEALGMRTGWSIVTDDYPSSMYLAILDSDRDMKIAMSDMRILRAMTPEALEPALNELKEDDMIVLDANLDLECIGYILDHAVCRIAADPVSAGKAARLKNRLKDLTIFKPNRYEAQELSGITIHDEKSAAESLDWFLQQGVKEIIISMAEGGILAADQNEKIWFTHRMILVENATGAGDTFLGAYAAKRLHGCGLREAARYGISAAICAIEQDAVNRRSLNASEVEKQIAAAEIKERLL